LGVRHQPPVYGVAGLIVGLFYNLHYDAVAVILRVGSDSR
jgi:hypothetical protein